MPQRNRACLQGNAIATADGYLNGELGPCMLHVLAQLRTCNQKWSPACQTVIYGLDQCSWESRIADHSVKCVGSAKAFVVDCWPSCLARLYDAQFFILQHTHVQMIATPLVELYPSLLRNFSVCRFYTYSELAGIYRRGQIAAVISMYTLCMLGNHHYDSLYVQQVASSFLRTHLLQYCKAGHTASIYNMPQTAAKSSSSCQVVLCPDYLALFSIFAIPYSSQCSTILHMHSATHCVPAKTLTTNVADFSHINVLHMTVHDAV